MCSIVDTNIDTNNQKTQCGFVALLGLPNAGKSLLLNQILSRKVAIVSHKRNATRLPVRGILNYEASQIIFIDTPGIDTINTSNLIQQMIQLSWQTAQSSDVLVVVIDSSVGLSNEVKLLLNRIKSLPKSKHIVLNKIDLVHKPKLLELTQKLVEVIDCDEVFMLSATSNNGLDVFVSKLAQIMPVGDFLYPVDLHTDLSLELWAAEITRESIMYLCHNEVPYELIVKTTQVLKRVQELFLYQEIQVSNINHKMIVIGQHGKKIKSIGINARLQMQQFLEKTVHLFLTVKVYKNLKLLS